ncbi:LacI family DNA-binding transcriptional regulator [Thioclava sp. DLFJ4-1]|uniref:LacI family DNA-binding transcriptional regulator n=1 Tax=Thioclava sp. DLFJ4-1 TaxID=1915313 RepID=UPI0009D56830|nr:LacI family DNA-binding transcriptional regulator [Thioclava sp. DLFJ4-1]OOY14486.1 hypothetical protein BMI85_20495 [Thioclava sp. DLFJ4-1]
MTRKVTAAEVARAAGVSPATVDRVLNSRGGVSADKELAVLTAARRLGIDRALNKRAARTLRIAVLVQPRTNPFHELVQRQFEDASRTYARFNMQFRIHHADPGDMAQVAKKIRSLATDHDAIVLLSPEDPRLGEALEAFHRTAKPVIAMATELSSIGPHQYVGPDNQQSGRVAGDLMARLLGSAGGDVLVVAGLLSMTGQRQRVHGFAEVLAERYPEVRIATVLESREQGENAGDLVYAALKRNPRLRGIYNASAGAPAVVRARAALNRMDTIFITHELTDTYRDLLQKGAIDAILDQDPKQEVRIVVELLASRFGRAEFPPTLVTPVRIHMIENG